MKRLRCALVLLGVVAAARADVIHVPGDVAELQAALDQAVPGDEVVIAPGEYEVTVEVETLIGVTVRGQGKVVLRPATPNFPIIHLISCAAVVLDRLRLVDAQGQALRLVNCEEVSVRRCRIENAAADGVHIVDGSDITLDRCVVATAGSDGVAASGTSGLTLTRCTIDGADVGLRIAGGFGHFIERVTVTDSDTDAIRLGPDGAVDSSILRRCLVRDAGDFGLSIDGSALLVEDNRIQDTTSAGVDVAGGTIVFRKNLLQRPGDHGFDISGGDHQLLDNRILESTLTSMTGTSTGPQVIRGNRVVKSGSAGIGLGAGNGGSTVVDNSVTAPGGDGIFIACGDVKLSENRVIGAGHDGFAIYGVGNFLTGNIGKGSANFDHFDSLPGGNTYVDNQFGTSNLD